MQALSKTRKRIKTKIDYPKCEKEVRTELTKDILQGSFLSDK